VAGQEKDAGKTVWVQPYNSLSGCDTSPDNCLGMVYYNWGPSYAKIAQSVVDGTWEQSWDWVGPTFSDEEGKAFDDLSMTGYMPREGLSEENLAKLNEFIDEVKAFAADEANAGKIFLWDDSLELQDGTTLGEAAADKPTSDTYQLSVWYLPQLLKGIVGASE
jgi:simple sugar transport system substrate-binding protein